MDFEKTNKNKFSLWMVLTFLIIYVNINHHLLKDGLSSMNDLIGSKIQEILSLDESDFRFSKMLEQVPVVQRPTVPVGSNEPGSREFFNPTPEQTVQLCLVIWQSATVRRNETDKKYLLAYHRAEDLVTATRNAVFQSLLSYTHNGSKNAAMLLAKKMMDVYGPTILKYAKYWKSVAKPGTMYRDNGDTIYLARRKDRQVVVGLNSCDVVFEFDEATYSKDYPDSKE